ncbi:MAG: hypothetical protein HOE48_01855 [Candidatus Latescibacteria bacterium]|nr:hypothetical protein [Candidatus Latescibacterota bacterium]
MGISVEKIDLHVLNMHTRFPFKYGIASLVALPHLFVRVTVKIEGKSEVGLAADGLPPKWFTKNPEAHFTEDLDEMLAVIWHACRHIEGMGEASTVFDLWDRLYKGQAEWAKTTAYPPLLWAFGVSLIERAVIDAFCRAKGITFAEAVQNNSLGIWLGDIHPELKNTSPSDFLANESLDGVLVRHTVGLADPLTDEEIESADRIDDGLPHSLAANIQMYGLTHLKIKLCGDAAVDLSRLKQIAGLMAGQAECAFTLDGNEQYTEMAPFRTLWEAIYGDAELASFMNGLIFVEQPLHRDVALSAEVKDELKSWTDRPPMIIDESDGSLNSSFQALDCGYVGTSHKNCKGVFKGIANACLMASRKKKDPEGTYILSSEDLANVGPVALLQDLAVLASLGVAHSERNGHHYFAGLSMYPDAIQQDVLTHHGELYRKSANGFPVLNVRDGLLDISSVTRAPFGYGFELDTTQFTALEDWTADSLEL